MKFQIAFLAALAAFTFTLTSLAAVPPARPRPSRLPKARASPQAGVPPGTTYTYTYSGPANPAVLPASPTTGRPARIRALIWSDDRWWYFTPDSRWLLYGQNGWSNPAAAETHPYAVGIPSGYQYGPAGSRFYTYPGYGNYYPSRFPANNPGMFGAFEVGFDFKRAPHELAGP